MLQPLTAGHVQQLVEQFYAAADQRAAKPLQEQMQAIQRLPEAWELASQLLSLNSEASQFFGAHTFQVKIARDWATLPSERVEWLRSELIGWTIKCSGGPMYIVRKLCVALISYGFKVTPEQCQHFIPETVNALATGASTFGADTTNQVILEYLTLLPQEVSNADLTGTRRVQILQECKDAIPLVLSTLATLLHQSQSTEIALKCFASWIQYGIDIEQAYPLLEQTMKLLVSNDDVLEVAAEALIEGMQQSTWSNYQNFRNGLLVSFTSDAIMLKCKTSLEEEDEILGRALAKLLTTFAETYVDDIAGQLALPEIRNLMTMILQLTGFPGFYPVDQAVSEIPLNFWFMLQETLFDQGLIPVRHAAAIPDGDDDISLTQPTDNEQLAWNRQCGETALALYRDLLGIIEQKSVFPGSSVWQSWTKDLKDKFRSCRRDLGDTMINVYFVLGSELLTIETNHIFAYMQQGATLPLEASLFCLRMVSEEIPASENDHISKLFASTFLSQLASDPNIRLRNTCLGLLGSLADWLNEHPQYLVSAMNFIVPCMGEPRLSMQAANSFANICNTCRASLIDNLDSLMAVYGSTSASTMEPLAMHKVVESVAAVIQVLPIERSLRPLMTLTASIFQAIEYGFQQDQEMARTTMLSQLKNLTACCKGIQSPDDDYASLSERNRQFDAFASGQLSAMCTQVEGFQETTASLQHVIQQCMLHWSKDEDIARILTQFLEAGIRSMSPLLTLTFSDLTHLIDSGYKAGRFAYWLETTSLVITVYGGHPPHLPVLCSLFDSLTTCTFQGITSTADMEQCPDVIHSYFNLLDRITLRCPRLFCELAAERWDFILSLAIAAMGLQERLALKAALTFMADFVVCQDTNDDKVNELVNNMILKVGFQVMEKLLMGVGGGVPRSFSKPLVDVLYKLTTHYLQQSRQWLQVLLAQEGFPSALVNQTDKDIFIKGILGHRSLKKFKEYTNDFSKKCRGLGDTTFG